MSAALEAHREIQRRSALAVLSDEELGATPLLWLLRDALDRYAEAARDSARDDYFGCELVEGVCLRPVRLLHVDDRCVSVERNEDALFSEQAPRAALTLYERLMMQWTSVPPDVLVEFRVDTEEEMPVFLDYERALQVLDRIEEAVRTVG